MEEKQKINEYQVRVTGKASLMSKLELSHDYDLHLTGNVYSAKAKDRQDGSMDIEYALKLITAEITSDKGEIIKVKDKKSWSRKLRSLIYIFQGEIGNSEDEEIFYAKAMNYITANLWEILRKL